MRCVKLLYSIKDIFPAWRADVIELFSNELARRNVQVTWFMRRKQRGQCINDSVNGQPVYLPWHSGRSSVPHKVANTVASLLCNLRFIVRGSGDPVDVIQVRDQYFAALVGLTVARLRGTKFVYWLSYPFPEHDLEMAKQAKFPRRLLLMTRGWFGKAIVYHWVMRKSDHNFVQSEQMKRDIAVYGVPLTSMTPVPMGVSTRVVDEYAALSRSGQVETGLVAYLGTLAAVRRMDTIIRAFKRVHDQMPSARLLMVGDGDHPHERQALMDEAERLGLADAITFTGFVPMSQALALTSRAEICISPIYPTPILRCSSPTKIIEYMAMGKPVVANDHPEQSDILAQSGAGICVPWDEQAFSDAILTLLGNPTLAAEMGARGPGWVREHRTYDHIADMVHAKYRQILGWD